MSEMVRRIFVEKKEGFDIEAQNLFADLRNNLGIKELEGVRIVNRYDISGITDQEFNDSKSTIFSEPTVDKIYCEQFEFPPNSRVFAMEYLPGQYDQRADSAAQCIQMLTQKERPSVKVAKMVILLGPISDGDFQRIKEYCINPVDSREADLDKPESLDFEADIPEDVKIVEGFIDKGEEELESFMTAMGFAMSLEDLKFLQSYFRDVEGRDPTITELKVIDTYWSDHCRHTTFHTQIEDVSIEEGRYTEPVSQAYEEYKNARKDIYGDRAKEVSLMDIAVIGMKELKKKGLLDDLDESEEINACSIKVNVDVDGENQEWLVMFKNETHNHPTEIEPFGGAATCLGGAIRDPLSGRAYVYQAMRVTGSGDPRRRIEETLPGKLSQYKITTGAAAGFSSYGNQIGLATGLVHEIYDEGYVAKRMEIGAVIAAAPKGNVIRKTPAEGDIVLLVGGRTGRDGCGGATGSSKEHTEESILTCGAEVQKGNPVEERKLQRLFRNPEASRLIKRCNDFGAGGVSVAIGELTDGLDIDLDRIPKKYEGLDGTELAISESQERMAVVVAPEDADRFIRLARAENLEATPVAKVTSSRRLRMFWRGKAIVDISRDFLNTNGVKQSTKVFVKAPDEKVDLQHFIDEKVREELPDLKRAWLANLRNLNVCSQRGLVERFDSTIGAGTVLMPFGGIYQNTPAEGMVAKIPVIKGETTTGTAMAYGYNPLLAKWSPFHGALYSIVEAVTKIVALGGDFRKTRLTLQEYFEKLGKDPVKWGKPFSALLGAYYAQKRLGIPAIGGKDSMSGTFHDLNVPPTLVAFAVAVLNTSQVVSQEFKKVGSKVVLVPAARDCFELPDFEALKKNFDRVTHAIHSGKVLSSHTVTFGGLAEAVSKMCFGNKIGMKFIKLMDETGLFAPSYGSIVLEIDAAADPEKLLGDLAYQLLGYTQEEPVISVNGIELELNDLLDAWEEPLEKVFPTRVEANEDEPIHFRCEMRNTAKPAFRTAKPRVIIPVFPGTNCEYDSARAFERAGAIVDTLVIRNLTPSEIEDSLEALVKAINNAQILMLPGGFSAGDEPDGSGKFISTMFRNPRVKDAVMDLLKKRDGLILGICNGFQALIKLGLVPFGEIVDITEDCPTLTFNRIGRHVSRMVRTKIVSTLSPWFSKARLGDIHVIPVSHGEGRFVANEQWIQTLMKNGQIATQYVDLDGNPTYDIAFNPNGSVHAIEGITSPDGRVLGKMGHSERIGFGTLINIPGEKDQLIFESGVQYFK